MGRLEGLSNDFELQPTMIAASAKEVKTRLFSERIAVVKIDIVGSRQFALQLDGGWLEAFTSARSASDTQA